MTLLLAPHWPELSYTAVPNCNGGMEMQFVFVFLTLTKLIGLALIASGLVLEGFSGFVCPCFWVEAAVVFKTLFASSAFEPPGKPECTEPSLSPRTSGLFSRTEWGR